MSAKVFVLLPAALLLLPAPVHPQTGIAVPELAAFDRFMTEFIERWHIRGGSLAIAKDGRLVFARGYGLADVEAGAPVEPESLFRISSVSKTLTSAAIHQLAGQGRLDLDARVFALLDHLQPPPGAVADPRLFQITVRHLLQHTGGFDKDRNGVPDGNDPTRPPHTTRASEVLGGPWPADANTIIRYMMGQPLDFDPGTRFVYSTFGYCVLGRVIEKVSGKPYGEHVREAILKPAGITRPRLARSRLSDREPGEVRYYNYPAMPLYQSVFGEGLVPFAYGAYSTEATDSWIAPAMDLVRFASALDGTHRPALLAPEAVERMLTPADPALRTNYTLGWRMRVGTEGRSWWHFGGTPYTASSYLVRLPGGIAIAALFNGTAAGSYWTEMETTLNGMAQAVAQWPAHDFSPLYYADAPRRPETVRTGIQGRPGFQR